MLTTYIAAVNIALLILISMLMVQDSMTRSNRYLLGFFVIMGLVAVLRFGILVGGFILIWLPFIVFPAAFLLGPLLYLYTRLTLFKRSTTRTEALLLALPPLCVFLTHCAVNITHPETTAPENIQSMNGFAEIYTRSLFFLGSIYNMAFEIRALFLLRRYRIEFLDNFSSTLRDQPGWIRTLLLMNVSLASLYLVTTVYSWGSGSFFFPVGWPEGLIVLALAYLAVFYYAKKPQIFAIQPIDSKSNDENSEKYARQNLSESMRKEYLQKIETYFAEEKPFLDERVTLAGLSGVLNIPAHHLSMVINIEKQLNFFNFINKYRIEEAKLLLDESRANETILAIAFRAGFQSKAVFNRVFKEQTGLTPTAYRQIASGGIR
ncbi:MAG: AraC family transcriptional regulator [Spirochaetia bacterium]|nr:AraC family transcriptional regulator [Spirochaetia bacterium]